MSNWEYNRERRDRMISHEGDKQQTNIEEIKRDIDCLIQWKEYEALSKLFESNTELQEMTNEFKLLTKIISLYNLQKDMGENTILSYGDSVDACITFYLQYTYYLLAANENKKNRESEEWNRLVRLLEKERMTAIEIISTCAFIRLCDMEDFIEALGSFLYESGNRKLSVQLLALYLDIYEVADSIALDLATIFLYEEDIEEAKEFLQRVQVQDDAYMELSRQICR